MNKRFVIGSLVSLFSFANISYAETNNNLIINEVQVANIDQYIDPSYNYGGWIEIYNPNDQIVNLSGMKVRHTDSDNTVETYTLTSSHGSIAAKGFSCLWFDHNSQDGYYGSKANTQIRYKLDADGGKIELLNANDEVINSVVYPAAIARCSYLRTTDGGPNWSFTSNPTPGISNNNTTFATKRLDSPIIDTEAKVFSSAFSFKVTIPKQAKLYYTTDGSTPISGQSEISLDGNFTVDKTIIYRFLLVREGYLNSQVVTRSFIKNTQNYTLPVISISTHPNNLFDDSIGVYVRGTNGRIDNGSVTKANQNMDWERPVNFEYIVPDSNGIYSTKLNQEVSFKIFGGWSRFEAGNEEWEERPSFKLKAEKQYEGIGELSYTFFSSKPYIKLKSILVRNGGQDQGAKIKDAVIQEIASSSGLYIDCQPWQPSHVFLNGKYLGFLNIREESNQRFAYSDYGVDSEDIDQWEFDINVVRGDTKQLDYWLNQCTQLGNNPTKENWQKIEKVLDVDEFCNYFALQCYLGNTDWFKNDKGSFINIKGFCPRSDNGKIHYTLYDTDIAFAAKDVINRIYSKGTSKTAKAFMNMLKYEPFKKRFIDAFCIIGGSVYAGDKAIKKIESMAEQVEPAAQLEGLTTQTRVKILSRNISERTLHYNETIENLRTEFDLPEGYNIKLSSNNTIVGYRFLLNGQEISTGQFDGIMFAPIVLTAIAPAGYQFESWKVDGKVLSTDSIINFSTLKKVGTYTITAQFKTISNSKINPIRINEVSAGNDIFINEYGKKTDYIELYNTTDKDINVEDCYLSDNVDDPMKYKISGGTKNVSTIIPANGYKIIWCDNKDTDTQLHANFKLDNSDNAFVSFTASDGSWSDCLEYKAQDRWYTFGRYPDGGNQVALFRRPTIENANHICYDTELYSDSSSSKSPQITSYTLEISNTEWATLCVPFNFQIPENIKIYTVDGIMADGNHLSLKTVTSPIANKPYLINGPTGKYILSGTFVKGDDTQSDYLINGLMTGTLSYINAPTNSYVLQDLNNLVGFYSVSDDKNISVPAYHAYLKINNSNKAMFHITEDTSDLDFISNSKDDTIIFNQFGYSIKSIQSSGIYIIHSLDGKNKKIQIK